MIEERLTTLNPKSQSFEGGAGGFGAMSVQEFAACLAGTKPIGEYILWRKYVNDKDKRPGYYVLLNNIVNKVYEADKLPKQNDLLEPMLNVALNDYCGGAQCPQCKGKGKVILPTGLERACRSTLCSGSGRRAYKDHEKAKMIGVKALDFSRHCKQAYLVIERYLTVTLPEAESQALTHVIKRARWN